MAPCPRRASLACVMLAAALPLLAADDPPHRVPRATSEITIDGALIEPAWQDALALDLSYETTPGENTPPPARTTCYFAYDESSLYAGCRALDPSPGAIRARYCDRDNAFQDDFAGIVVDTMNDERRAFEFFVNPLGVQMDLGYTDDRRNNLDGVSSDDLEPIGRSLFFKIGYAWVP